MIRAIILIIATATAVTAIVAHDIHNERQTQGAEAQRFLDQMNAQMEEALAVRRHEAIHGTKAGNARLAELTGTKEARLEAELADLKARQAALESEVRRTAGRAGDAKRP